MGIEIIYAIALLCMGGTHTKNGYLQNRSGEDVQLCQQKYMDCVMAPTVPLELDYARKLVGCISTVKQK